MNVMSSYAGAATTVALSASGDLQPYYMGIDLSGVPFPLVVAGTVVGVCVLCYATFKLFEFVMNGGF